MMRFASLFGVLQSSALKTAIVKKKRRENLFIPIKTANFADRIYKVVSMSKTVIFACLVERHFSRHSCDVPSPALFCWKRHGKAGWHGVPSWQSYLSRTDTALRGKMV